MQKLYSRINWENRPSIETPLNEQNLNRMDASIDDIDNRIISQDIEKADKTELNDLVADWSIDEETGIITITKKSGEKILFDLNIEKIPVSFSLSDDGILTMTTDDGTEFTANIGAMIPILIFNDSDTISVSVSGIGVNKTYSFSVKNGSITEEKLRPNYLGDIKLESAKAEASAATAVEKATESVTSSTASKSYAVGETGTRQGEDTDNAKYYSEQAKSALESIGQAGTVTGVKGNEETTYRTGNVNITKSNIGLGNVNNTSDMDKPVSTAMQAALDLFYANANQFTLNKIAELINGAPATMDTLKEIADAMATHQTVVNALDAAIGQKANQAELDTHINNGNIHFTASERQQLGSLVSQFGGKADAIAPIKCNTLPSNLTSKMSINNLSYNSDMGYCYLGYYLNDYLNSQFVYVEGSVYKVYKSGYYHLYMRCYMTACSRPECVKRMQIRSESDYELFAMQRASTYEMMCDSTIVYRSAGSIINPVFQMDSYGATVTTSTLSVVVGITPIFVH